jgi:hypothetical protein
VFCLKLLSWAINEAAVAVTWQWQLDEVASLDVIKLWCVLRGGVWEGYYVTCTELVNPVTFMRFKLGVCECSVCCIQKYNFSHGTCVFCTVFHQSALYSC